MHYIELLLLLIPELLFLLEKKAKETSTSRWNPCHSCWPCPCSWDAHSGSWAMSAAKPEMFYCHLYNTNLQRGKSICVFHTTLYCNFRLSFSELLQHTHMQCSCLLYCTTAYASFISFMVTEMWSYCVLPFCKIFCTVNASHQYFCFCRTERRPPGGGRRRLFSEEQERKGSLWIWSSPTM